MIQIDGKEFESPHSDASISQDDVKFLSILEQGIYQDESGFYVTPLPFWENGKTVSSNYEPVLKRFHGLLAQFSRKSKEFETKYREFMTGVIARGEAELVPQSDQKTGESWYLPHHGVLKIICYHCWLQWATENRWFIIIAPHTCQAVHIIGPTTTKPEYRDVCASCTNNQCPKWWLVEFDNCDAATLTSDWFGCETQKFSKRIACGSELNWGLGLWSLWVEWRDALRISWVESRDARWVSWVESASGVDCCVKIKSWILVM